MNIALIGYGKMGHAIERIALERGHNVVARIDVNNREDLDSEAFASADVVIEFTRPDTAVANIRECFKRGKKVVCGTTGWTAAMPEMRKACQEDGATFFWTSNFSIGVNIFFALNRYLARLMERFPQYTPAMTEVHHVHKLDHPSGTAITLAEGVVEENSRVDGWVEEPAEPSKMVVSHIREGEVPGTHIIKWDSPIDTISIEHRAKSRDGFALGAVMAAEYTASRSGFLTMDGMMGELLGSQE